MVSPAVTGAARPRIVYLYLAIVVVSWAGNWPIMKLALADAPGPIFVLLRLVGTLALMGPMLTAMRAPLLPRRGERLGQFIVGQLQVAGFMIFSILGLSILPAGRAIVLAYTMPLWAIPIELWFAPDRPRGGQLVGAAVGFAGLLLFMNPGLVDWSDWRVLAGNAMLLLAAMSWALGSVLYRRQAWRSSFWTQTFWQILVSTPVIAAIAAPLSIGRTDPLDPDTDPGPGLQLGNHDRARLFSVEQGSLGDAGRRRGSGHGADPGRRISAVGRDLRRRDHRRCRRQHRA